MENNPEKQTQEAAAQESTYVPRPAWQVWAARLGLVLFIVIMIAQILGIARGGF